MSSDKITIGLTPENKRIALKLVEGDWFETQIDAAKFAMAFAIMRNVAPGTADKTETVWNTGSFDDDGTLRTMMPAFFPGTDQPYKLVEYYINVGLGIVEQELAGGSTMLTQLLDAAGQKQEKLI
jgi:hypothetical protein